DLTVEDGQRLIVSSGGVAVTETLRNAAEVVEVGGKIGGTVAFGQHARLTIIGTRPSPLTASGFGKSDTLDFRSFKPGRAETVSFVENAAHTKGVLTIKDGAMKATVTLFGQYVAAGFKIGEDGAGGTALTYAAPTHSAHVELAQHG